MDRGNIVIIGLSGSGKKTICQLAAFIRNMTIFDINN